jgi:PAS domain S-box-containing protein
MILSSSFAQSMFAKRRRAEEVLRENEEMLCATIESSVNGVLVVDGKGQVVHTNTRFAELWRIPEDIIKTGDDNKLIEFVLNQLEHPQLFLDKVQKLYRSSDEDLDQLTFKDGRIFERFSYPLMRNGKVGGRVWSFTDITERVRNEASLKLTQFTIDQAADPIFWIGEKAQIIYVNDTACRKLGYTREELLKMTVHDIDPDFPVKAWPAHWAEMKQRVSFTLESLHKTKDGVVFPVEVSVNYVEFEGREYNCAFSRDITTRRRVFEEHERQAADLKKRIADLESETSVRSHKTEV